MHPILTPPTPRRHLRLLLLLALCGTGAALASETATAPVAARATPTRPGPLATPAALKLSAHPPALVARFVVTLTPGRGKPERHSTHAWTFLRDAHQVALLKGSIDEIWHRDDQGRLSFERIFHDDQQAVDYGAGELAALGVEADWTALSTFVDPRELTGLRVVSRRGQGREEILSLRGQTRHGSLVLDWQPALQLPKRLVRTEAGGQVTRFELAQAASLEPGPDGPRPGDRSAHYLRFDAADFGDMDYEKVVKKSEALDIRSGWRTAHHHD